MNICKVWDAEYPWDVRVEKVSRALTEGGHSVHLVVRNRDNRLATEALDEATVHRIPWAPLLGRHLNAVSMFPAFFNPRWIGIINRTVVNTGAELILCRDIPLAPAAIWVGRRRNIPVVLDMAENYPAMIRDVWESDRHRPFDWLVRNPRIVKLVEQFVVRNVDHIIVVVEESMDRVVELGVSKDRVSVVSNTPSRTRVATSQSRNGDARRNGELLHIVYLGLLEVPRGLGVLLDAVRICDHEGMPIHLTIIGTGRDREMFETQAQGLGLDRSTVKFHGYLKNKDALRLVETADVGVVPHFASESWNTTIPNKLFDYMAGGLAVVTSDAKPTARVVAESGCGVVFRDRDAADLARALRAMRDPSARRACGKAGMAAISQRYNWERDSATLKSTLEEVVRRRQAYTAHTGTHS